MSTTPVRYGEHTFQFPNEGRPCRNGVTDEHDAGRFYELDLLEDSRSICESKPNALVIDVGANLGNHTIFWAGVCRVPVLSIEADAQLFALLSKAVYLNIDRIKIPAFLRAVCGDGGRARERPNPQDPSASPGNRCFCADPNGDIDTVVLAHTAMCQLVPSGAVSIIKIDVEGMELDVLRGASELLRLYHPVIYAEAWDHIAFEQIHSFLHGHGYLQMAQAFGHTYKWVP